MGFYYLSVAIPYKSGKYSYISDTGKVLDTLVLKASQSLINQGNILTMLLLNVIPGCGNKEVAIPYKSGKYSYMVFPVIFSNFWKFLSQSLINQGNILTFFLCIVAGIGLEQLRRNPL